jgi:hypothetical protein
MARAAAPMFSPIWGSTRITTGPSVQGADFLRSVPVMPGFYSLFGQEAMKGVSNWKPVLKILIFNRLHIKIDLWEEE